MLFDDVLQCAIPTYFFSFSMFFILVYKQLMQNDHRHPGIATIVRIDVVVLSQR